MFWRLTRSPMLLRLTRFQVGFHNPERGATSVEYALMVSLIAIVIIIAVKLLGTGVSTLFNRTATSI